MDSRFALVSGSASRRASITLITVSSTCVSVPTSWLSETMKQPVEHTVLAIATGLPLVSIITAVDGVITLSAGTSVTTVKQISATPNTTSQVAGDIACNKWECWGSRTKAGVITVGVSGAMVILLCLICFCHACFRRARRAEKDEEYGTSSGVLRGHYNGNSTSGRNEMSGALRSPSLSPVLRPVPLIDSYTLHHRSSVPRAVHFAELQSSASSNKTVMYDMGLPMSGIPSTSKPNIARVPRVRPNFNLRTRGSLIQANGEGFDEMVQISRANYMELMRAAHTGHPLQRQR